MIAVVAIAWTTRVNYGELPMHLNKSLGSRAGGVACGGERLSPNSSTSFGYDSLPLLGLRNKVNAYKSRAVVSLHDFVASIVRIRSLSKFAYPVVVPDAKSVIDLIFGPCSMEMSPRELMRRIVHPLSNLDCHIATLRYVSSAFSGIPCVPLFGHVWAETPRKQPSKRVVVQNGSYKFGSERGMPRHSYSNQPLMLVSHNMAAINTQPLEIGG